MRRIERCILAAAFFRRAILRLSLEAGRRSLLSSTSFAMPSPTEYFSNLAILERKAWRLAGQELSSPVLMVSCRVKSNGLAVMPSINELVWVSRCL